jgi:hypothetical protein
MPFYLPVSKCINPHTNEPWNRFDPISSDSNFPTLFCSLQCEKEWVASCLGNLTLVDVFEIQALTKNVIGMDTFAATGGN